MFVTADPELPVPPTLYGGIERVIAQLVDGLVERGHSVTLFAHPESRTRARLVAYAGTRSRSRADTARHAVAIAREFLAVRPEVVHSFGRLAYLAPILASSVPKVMSYQRAVTPNRVAWAHRASRGTLSFTGCSRHLVEPVRTIGSWRVVYNGVPMERYRFAATVAFDAPLVFLGRIEAIKGPHLAIEVARRAGRRLVLAGNVAPEHQAYFDAEIAPAVDGLAVTYVGPVDDDAKGRLLSEAAALVMPVLWDEPFGIVMAEALACGTPVIGLARGAVTEVVDDGRTGFVCESVEAMVRAVSLLSQVSREACRRVAERRFSSQTMLDAYETLYVDRVTQEATARTPVGTSGSEW